MKKLLIKLYIVQVVSNEERHKNGLKKLGRGCFKAYRLNPFNPLSYILLTLVIPILILLYVFIGIRQEVELKNPFKWD